MCDQFFMAHRVQSPLNFLRNYLSEITQSASMDTMMMTINRPLDKWNLTAGKPPSISDFFVRCYGRVSPRFGDERTIHGNKSCTDWEGKRLSFCSFEMDLCTFQGELTIVMGKAGQGVRSFPIFFV